MKLNLEKTFDFGKVDYYGRGRRVNKVDVTVRLYDKGDGRAVLGIAGGFWNGRGTDYMHCGQCLDAIAKFVDDPLFLKIYGWWKDFRNNGTRCCASPKQEAAVGEWLAVGHTYDYDKVCSMLKSKNLLIDKSYIVDGEPFRYGSKWIYKEIPKNVIEEIKSVLQQ